MESKMGISNEDFREGAREIVEYVIKYYGTLSERQAAPHIETHFLRKRFPSSPPATGGDKCRELLEDFDRIIMEGITHMQSPTHFGYFSNSTSYPTILASMLFEACDYVSYARISSPSTSELEGLMMDWLAKALDLPKCFWYEEHGPGCGNIQGTASEAIVMTLIAARTKMIKRKMSEDKALTKHDVLARLVSYTSEYAHSAVERAALIGMVDMRLLPVDEDVSLRGETLRRAIEEDKAAGRIPFYVCATLGTTACCSYDNLPEIGKICNDENIFLHVDAAYAGNSFICPEFRHRMAGVELADSFNFNPHKWLMVNFDCSALWVRDTHDMAESLHVEEAAYMRQEEHNEVDYRDWTIPLGRRFRSLKLWFVFRMVGVEGMRARIRKFVRLAQMFESFVRTDSRFEVLYPVELGLVCIRLAKDKDNVKKNRDINIRLVKQIRDSKELLISHGEVGQMYYLRISIGSVTCDEKAIKNCWQVLQKYATSVLQSSEMAD